MSEKIDWSKAPDSAMVLLKHVRDGAYAVAESFSDDARTWHFPEVNYTFSLMPSMWHVVSRRPATPSWSGEGLPPVGAVCEIAASTEYLKISHPEGTRVKVYATFTDDRGVELVAFVDELGMVAGVAIAKSFRPIRTKEQIEADEREAQIVAIHDAIVTSVKVTLGQCNSWRKVAEMVYNAGFKRE